MSALCDESNMPGSELRYRERSQSYLAKKAKVDAAKKTNKPKAKSIEVNADDEPQAKKRKSNPKKD